MAHLHDEDEIPGLAAALQKLPAPFRMRAADEFHRALFEDGFAEFSRPATIHYAGPSGGRWRRAVLVIVICENFIFDLFFVPVRRRRFVPVVGRVYLDPPVDQRLAPN